MSLHKIKSINSQLAKKRPKSSTKRPAIAKTFADDSYFQSQDPNGPLSMVKAFNIIDFTEENSPSNDSLCNYYFSKGLEQYKSFEYFSAIHTFKRATAYDQENFESLINLGSCYFRLQMMEEAITSYAKAIKIHPFNYIGYYNKSLSEMQLQEYNRVIITIDHALTVLQDPPEELYKIRTYVLFQSGRVANITNELQVKNGFEKSKFKSARKINTQSPSLAKQNSRPRTSSTHRGNIKRHTIWHLFPNTNNTFIQVQELETHSIGKTVSQVTSATISPKQKPRILFKNIQRPRSGVKSYKVSGSKDIESKDYAKAKHYSVEPKTIYQPGIIQINALDRNEDFLEDKETATKFIQNIKALRKYVAKDLERAEELKELVKPNDYQFISESEIKVLIEEFNKEKRSLEKIDKIAMKLEFLQKFPLPMRESIYSCACISKFKPGQVIFNDGDPGDSMYVIIKGSVIMNKMINEIRNYPVIISSLYDGRQFGDASVLSSLTEQENRKGTCVVTEPSTMFIIPKQEYKRLLFKYLKPELEAKVNFLTTVRLFRGTEIAALYTLASNVQIVKSGLGDVILAKGEIPKGMYIVAKGHVEVVTEGFVKKQSKPRIYGNAKIREKSPKPFYTGNASPSSSPKIKSADMTSNPEGFLKVCYKSQSEDVQADMVKDKILNFVLHSTEFFGGKTLIDGEIFSGLLMKATPSKFSFIAKSSEVEIMIITKDFLQFLDSTTEFRLKNYLSKVFHIDSPDDTDPQEMDEFFNKWQQYKQELTEDIRRLKYLERNKMDFPYIR